MVLTRDAQITKAVRARHGLQARDIMTALLTAAGNENDAELGPTISSASFASCLDPFIMQAS